MANTRKFKNNLTLNIIIATTVLLVTFGIVVAAIGYTKFYGTMFDRYEEGAYATARSTADFVNGDHIAAYLENADKINGTTPIEDSETEIQALKKEWETSTAWLNKFAKSQGVAIIYIIVPNKDDYSTYYSVINCPNSDFVPYSAWALGSEQHHSQPNEYDAIYKDIMENGLERANVTVRQKSNNGISHINSLMPIKDSTGKVTGIIVVQQTMELITELGMSYTWLIVITTVVLIVVTVFGYILLVRKQFVTPIKAIVEEAQRFAKDNSEAEHPIDGEISNIHELSMLGEAIGQMEIDTLKNIKNLSQAIKDKQKINSELGIAKQIQEASLPNTFPAFPDRTEFDLFASMRPAKQVGGDFYDFFLVDDDHLALVIADVSGKGVPAALFMMVTKILIYERTMLGGTPAEVLEFVNNRICEHNQAEMFVTVWLGILEISTGKLTATNAGHDSPAIIKHTGVGDFISSKRGLVVGAMSGSKYHNFELTLEKGDKLFMFTDGVPESTDANKQMFTLKRTGETLCALHDKDPKTIIEGMELAIKEFVGDAPQFDDTTMLCVEYKGAPDKNHRTYTVAADIDNLPIVLKNTEDFLEDKGATPKVLNQLSIAIEEVFANVAHYAYPPKTGECTIDLNLKDKVFSITFTDQGTPYNPLEKDDPDVTLSAEERKEGGLGIFMTKKLMDNILYEHKDGQNILTLEKKL
ncbi:MAG: SpoIIE family protein phosphatase [Clostridia bacterium]|nr:SpoIIE family protein phosphatase [Clostridia bacterium]